MFTDGRGKKVIFLAHCLLNQNAISDGTAVCPAAFRELIQLLLDREVGIVGANRSPNCGVETTSDFDREVEGRGAFMDAIAQRLEAAGISVPMLGLKGSDGAAQKVATLL